MKKKIYLICAVFLLSSSSFATNGDNLIGIGSASRAMGGIGTGMPVGPIDSIFRNPAWMPFYNTKNFFLSFGGILFMPRVKTSAYATLDADEATPGGAVRLQTAGRVKSRADAFIVPEVGILYKVSERLAVGVGAFGVSGMGVDFRGKDPLLSQMRTNFQFMRITPTVAYRVNEFFAVGAGLHVAWGSLDVGATLCAFQDADGDGLPSPSRCWNAGGGQSQDIGLGFNLGVALRWKERFFAGLMYQSPVSMTYERVFDSDGDGRFEDMKLEQPQEVGFGAGAKVSERLKVGVDLRWIDWSGAEGYGDFDWRDQWVVAVGAEFKATPSLLLRAGWNWGRSPLRERSSLSYAPSVRVPDLKAPFSPYQVYWMNLVGFPAVAEHHLTLGLGWKVNPNFTLDLSYVYAFPSTVDAEGVGGASGVSARMYQHSLGVGLNWSF